MTYTQQTRDDAVKQRIAKTIQKHQKRLEGVRAQVNPEYYLDMAQKALKCAEHLAAIEAMCTLWEDLGYGLPDPVTIAYAAAGEGN